MVSQSPNEASIVQTPRVTFLPFVFQAVFYEYSTAAEAYAYRPAIQNEKKR